MDDVHVILLDFSFCTDYLVCQTVAFKPGQPSRTTTKQGLSKKHKLGKSKKHDLVQSNIVYSLILVIVIINYIFKFE